MFLNHIFFCQTHVLKQTGALNSIPQRPGRVCGAFIQPITSTDDVTVTVLFSLNKRIQLLPSKIAETWLSSAHHSHFLTAEGKAFDKSSPTLLIAEVHFTFSTPAPHHFSPVPERVSLCLLICFSQISLKSLNI